MIRVDPTSAQTGFIRLTVTNPTPTGGQPAIAGNDLYRRKQGETTWTRIKTGIANNGIYDDYAVASGVTYEYYVQANGDNNTSANSTIQTGSLTLTGVWLHDVADPAGTVHNFKYDGRSRDILWSAEAAMMQFAGRTRPTSEFGDSGEGKITVELDMSEKDNDSTKLDALVRRLGTICYRDSRGRKMFGVIPTLPLKDEHWGYSATIEIIETSYSEEV